MAMNRMHQWLCSSALWARSVDESFMPWALADVALRGDVLELGPGYGATTCVLQRDAGSLTALELSPQLAERVRRRCGPSVRVLVGDATRMPFGAACFDRVVCFTMLHHIPSQALQDDLFTEASRVLRPGGLFAGSDSMTSLGLRLLHRGDTMVLVEPRTLPGRLARAGFVDIRIEERPRYAFKFQARKP